MATTNDKLFAGAGYLKGVAFDPIIRHIAEKVEADRAKLMELIADTDTGLRNFLEHDRLVAELQAGLRAMDVLGGSVKLNGELPSLPRADLNGIEQTLGAIKQDVANVGHDIGSIFDKPAPQA